MQDLTISTRLLSEAAWRRIFESSAPRLFDRKPPLYDLLGSLERLRKSADYNTGSISAASAWALYAAVSYFGPRLIVEVGTFIGRSTLAMATASTDAGTAAEIHTCDQSNSIDLPEADKARIVQYQKKSSTEMLSAMAAAGRYEGKVEFLHLDGRLQEQDFPLIARLCAPNAIVAMDDFEGFEKGVANYVNIRRAQLFAAHLPIYPPSERLLRDFDFHDHSTTALLVPQASVRLTAQ